MLQQFRDSLFRRPRQGRSPLEQMVEQVLVELQREGLLDSKLDVQGQLTPEVEKRIQARLKCKTV